MDALRVARPPVVRQRPIDPAKRSVLPPDDAPARPDANGLQLPLRAERHRESPAPLERQKGTTDRAHAAEILGATRGSHSAFEPSAHQA